MSYTALIGWKDKVPYEVIEEYHNSHLFGYVIWDHLVYRHSDYLWGKIPQKDRRYFSGNDAIMNKLCEMADKKEFPEYHRAALVCTFDYVVIPAQTVFELTPLLREFALEMRLGKRTWEIAQDLEKYVANYTCFGFIGTSVCYNVWWDKEKEQDYDLTGDIHYTWQEAMEGTVDFSS